MIITLNVTCIPEKIKNVYDYPVSELYVIFLDTLFILLTHFLCISHAGRYKMASVEELSSQEFTVEYIYKTGFRRPIRMKERDNLGLRVPDPSFTVNDVE